MTTRTFVTCCVTVTVLSMLSPAFGESPDPITTSGEIAVTTINAQGAQIYQCMPDAEGKLTWRFREPVATLLIGDKTVGRHYAGPNWEMADGSAIVGKVAGTAPGASAADIPLLRLKVISRRGWGLLSNIVTVQRVNTRGGLANGDCATAGSFLNVPYSADYIFLERN